MSDKQYKLIRKQLRNVVKEILPEVLHAESVVAIGKTLNTHVDQRLDSITKLVRTTLDELDQRSKDMQSFVVRNVGVPTAPENPPLPEVTKT